MNNKIYDIVIIGAGIAGLTAAIYASRAGRSVLVLESKVTGGQIINALDVRNWPGETRISGTKLTEKIYHQVNNFGAHLRYETVDKIEKNVNIFKITTDETTHTARSIIIATGSRDRPMGLAREADLTGHGVSYCATCDGALYQGQDVIVVGGGNTAFYDVLYLAKLARKVYLVHRRQQFRAEQTLIEQAKQLPNVEFLLSYLPQAIVGKNTVEGLIIAPTPDQTVEKPVENFSTTNQISSERTIPASAIFVAIGRDPNTESFQNLIKLDEKGYIIASEDCQTSLPGVFAAGDCRTKSLRQLVTAAGDGATAAMSAVQYLDS